MLLRTTLLFLSFAALSFSYKIVALGPNALVNKLFFGGSQQTVDKVPPVFEYFLQRVQAIFSTYIHEDLSRPPTWDKPVYTLSPQDQMFFAALQDIDITTPRNSESSTEKLFEIIKEEDKGQLATIVQPSTQANKNKFEDFEYVDLEDVTEKLFEIISTTNRSIVYITPKTTMHASKDDQFTEKYIDPGLQLNLTINVKGDA